MPEEEEEKKKSATTKLYRLAKMELFIPNEDTGVVETATATALTDMLVQLSRVLRPVKAKRELKDALSFLGLNKLYEPYDWLNLSHFQLSFEPQTERVRCVFCGTTYGPADEYAVAFIAGQSFCLGCVCRVLPSLCAICGRYDGATRGLACPGCVDPNLPTCMNCMEPVDDVKAGLCDACAKEGKLVPYRVDVLEAFHKQVDGPRSLLGVELEIAPRNRDARLAIRELIADFAVMKDDRSIQPVEGVEIVTLPLTLEEHCIRWEPVFRQVIEPHCHAHDLCGLHVHFNAVWNYPGLPNTQDVRKMRARRIQAHNLRAIKVLKFIHRPSNIRLLEKIAGRPMTGGWAKQYFFQAPASSLSNFVMRNAGRNSHHSALNVSGRNNGSTMELRIFASTTSFEVFMARLEFTDSLSHFVNDVSVRQLLAKDYLEWLKGKGYPFLKFILGQRDKAPKTVSAVASKLRHNKENLWPMGTALIQRDKKAKPTGEGTMHQLYRTLERGTRLRPPTRFMRVDGTPGAYTLVGQPDPTWFAIPAAERTVPTPVPYDGMDDLAEEMDFEDDDVEDLNF